MAPTLAKRGLVTFEDETWLFLYPRVEVEWMHRSGQKRVLTPGYNKRRNTFVTFFLPRRDGFLLQHLPEEN